MTGDSAALQKISDSFAEGHSPLLRSRAPAFAVVLLISFSSATAFAQSFQESPAATRSIVNVSESVASSLSRNELTDHVLQQQQSIVDALTALLENATLANANPPPSASARRDPSRSTNSQQPQAGSSQNHSAAAEPHRDGTESSGVSDLQSPEDLGNLKRKADLANAIWGHLPPRVRDELYRSYTERYAPEYDQLLRRYFETLARQSTQSPK